MSFARIVAAALVATTCAWGQSDSPNNLLPDWLPTERSSAQIYAGSDRCIGCHAEQSSALTTAMGDALHRASESDFLPGRVLTFENGKYRYRLADGAYRVTDGESAIESPILWSFGHGKAGQTYILERDGRLYESRVSYYLSIDGLDQTLGAPIGDVPRNLEEAFGREMTPDDVRGCFGCHATGAVVDGRPELDRLTPGLQCEGCHGPGTEHLQAVADAQLDDLRIESLSGMGAEQESDFCGSCHRTWSQVVLMGLQGPANVRFQPYRLANSRCYDVDDPRIRCSACHDPHEDPVQEPSYYDSKCLACHEGGEEAEVGSAVTAPACPESSVECSRCHMPEVEIPGSHFHFTDHQIRVVEPGAPYPD